MADNKGPQHVMLAQGREMDGLGIPTTDQSRAIHGTGAGQLTDARQGLTNADCPTQVGHLRQTQGCFGRGNTPVMHGFSSCGSPWNCPEYYKSSFILKAGVLSWSGCWRWGAGALPHCGNPTTIDVMRGIHCLDLQSSGV